MVQASITRFLALIIPFFTNTQAQSEPDSLALATYKSNPPTIHQFHPTPPQNRDEDLFTDSQLQEIVLVASVDGKFHALNRTTGVKLWSMSSFTSDDTSVPSALSPLVQTQHSKIDPDLYHSSDAQETYIIEPQTGDIYVSTSSNLPLQRFPYTMAQLVDLTPRSFDSTGNGDKRMFVGKKETTLLLVELKTGKIKATIDPQCPWDQFQDFHDDDDDLDLDELESKSSPEVFIGRTDYRISIFDIKLGGSPKLMQNLSFSSYGPNNQDLPLQANYRHTKDSTYIQSLPDGNILSFKALSPNASKKRPPLWTNTFQEPIVAIFDVFTRSTSTEESSFVLLQPRPRLDEILYDHDNKGLSSTQSAFVGMVKESGSLYALGASQFPMVTFSNSKSLDRYKDEILELCQAREGPLAELRCPVGMNPVNDNSRPAPVPSPLPSPHRPDYPTIEGPAQEDGNRSTQKPDDVKTLPDEEQAVAWRTRLISILVAVLGIGFFISRASQRISAPPPSAIEVPSIPATDEQPIPKGRLIPPASIELPPSPAVTSEGDSSTPIGESLLSPEPQTPGEEIDTSAATPRKKTRRPHRGRGGKGKKKDKDGEEENETPVNEPGTPRSGISFSQPATTSKPPSLVVSDTILGYGSHGTVVYKGSLQGRAVAVKRLLQDFVILASREVTILQESDYHPNVIRYYYQEAHSNFLYIALELCPCSLADVIENPDKDEWRDIAISFEPKKALQQITAGLRHLHGLKLVHRDIKPQNILISSVKSIRDKPTYRMLISDFGLCKKLDLDQTSFLPTANGAMAAGTVGWRAPEILRGEVKLDEFSDENSVSSRGSIGTTSGGSTGNASGSGASGTPTRLTKSVDIFALGCLFYYTMTNGGHPFGDRFEREINILKNAKSLAGLERFGEEGAEAEDLIERMLSPESSARPDTATCLVHPFFWDSARRLNFLSEASDCFETMCRDPRDPSLNVLEEGAENVVGVDWRSRLDRNFLENLGKFRKYDGASVQDLLRALRNKKNHYQDLPDYVKRNMGPLPEGFLAYFTRRYPRLFLHVHSVVQNTPLRTDSRFRSYFHLSE